MSRISVVIPARNDSVMLAACLRALADQTRPADEIIVVDNGSTDDTAAVAVAAGVRVIQESLWGIFPATAAGFDAASGDVLARLDADSVPSPDWLARVAQVFESESELTALSGPGKFYGSTPLVHWIAENLYIGGYIFAIGLLLGHPPLFGSNLALRASAWRRLRPSVHRELREIHDDFDLSIHLEPDMVVRFDHSLVVGVSARPFETAAGLGRRTWWALAMLVEHSRERPFWERRAARRQWEREQAEEAFG